jgi:EmrB/QacA subfamily drug resistance transporter
MLFHLTEQNRKWWILSAMSSALALIYLNQTAVVVALPVIQRDLNLNNSLLQWVINAYLLSLSALVLLGGKIGDSLGHKRVFLWGISLFIGASILCSIAQSGAWLVTARVLQGIGGAFMMPSTTALVVNAFPEQECGKAVGIYVALAAIFLALGPFLGGMLTEWLSWHAVFWINVPIAIISVILAMSAVPSWQATEKFIIDYLGLLLSIMFISSFVLGFMEGPHWGWTSPTIISLFFLSIFSFAAFIFWERRFICPLVELQLFRNPIFSTVTVVIIIIQAVNIIFVFWAIFLQNILHYSPLQAGLLLLPAVGPTILIAPLSGYLRDKYGQKLPIFYGCLLISLGLVWIGFFSHYQSYLWLFPGLLSYGIGIPLILASTMVTITNAVTAQQRGIASAILNCARQSGGSVGLAVFAGFLATINKWQLSAFLSHAPAPFSSIQENQIDGLLVKSTAAMQAIRHLAPHFVELLKTAAIKAYTYAFSMTMYLAAALAFICLLLILKIPRNST